MTEPKRALRSGCAASRRRGAANAPFVGVPVRSRKKFVDDRRAKSWPPSLYYDSSRSSCAHGLATTAAVLMVQLQSSGTLDRSGPRVVPAMDVVSGRHRPSVQQLPGTHPSRLPVGLACIALWTGMAVGPRRSRRWMTSGTCHARSGLRSPRSDRPRIHPPVRLRHIDRPVDLPGRNGRRPDGGPSLRGVDLALVGLTPVMALFVFASRVSSRRECPGRQVPRWSSPRWMDPASADRELVVEFASDGASAIYGCLRRRDHRTVGVNHPGRAALPVGRRGQRRPGAPVVAEIASPSSALAAKDRGGARGPGRGAAGLS